MTQPAPPPARELPGVGPPLAAAALAGVMVVVTWWAFVTRYRGQVLEALALQGSHIGAWRIDAQADQLLSTVSVPMVAAILLTVLVIGILRGRWVAGIAAAADVQSRDPIARGHDIVTNLGERRTTQRHLD